MTPEEKKDFFKYLCEFFLINIIQRLDYYNLYNVYTSITEDIRNYVSDDIIDLIEQLDSKYIKSSINVQIDVLADTPLIKRTKARITYDTKLVIYNYINGIKSKPVSSSEKIVQRCILIEKTIHYYRGYLICSIFDINNHKKIILFNNNRQRSNIIDTETRTEVMAEDGNILINGLLLLCRINENPKNILSATKFFQSIDFYKEVFKIYYKIIKYIPELQTDYKFILELFLYDWSISDSIPYKKLIFFIKNINSRILFRIPDIEKIIKYNHKELFKFFPTEHNKYKKYIQNLDIETLIKCIIYIPDSKIKLLKENINKYLSKLESNEDNLIRLIQKKPLLLKYIRNIYKKYKIYYELVRVALKVNKEPTLFKYLPRKFNKEHYTIMTAIYSCPLIDINIKFFVKNFTISKLIKISNKTYTFVKKKWFLQSKFYKEFCKYIKFEYLKILLKKNLNKYMIKNILNKFVYLLN